jgi:TRSP domain C terminus to PRTase_2/Phosphoribosyl transferase
LHTDHLVLVDDELSTGQTFLALMNAYRSVNPALKKVSWVCLTDLIGQTVTACIQADAGATWDLQIISLLQGSFHFEPQHKAPTPAAPPAQAMVGCRREQVGPFSARLGTTQPVPLPAGFMDRLMQKLPEQRNVLVLGLGEFMHPAFVLARALAQQGRQVHVQSSTRSPILLGADVTKHIALEDPYGEGIPNHLYNVQPQAQTVLLCCENAPSNALSSTLTRLNAQLVDWSGRQP